MHANVIEHLQLRMVWCRVRPPIAHRATAALLPPHLPSTRLRRAPAQRVLRGIAETIGGRSSPPRATRIPSWSGRHVERPRDPRAASRRGRRPHRLPPVAVRGGGATGPLQLLPPCATSGSRNCEVCAIIAAAFPPTHRVYPLSDVGTVTSLIKRGSTTCSRSLGRPAVRRFSRAVEPR